jgi:hypothetical protein
VVEALDGRAGQATLDLVDEIRREPAAFGELPLAETPGPPGPRIFRPTNRVMSPIQRLSMCAA